MEEFYVYILTNFHRTVLYIGITNDLIRRVKEHQAKKNEGFTSDYNVDILVYFEKYQDVNNAIKREKQLKGWNRAKKDALIAKKNPDLKDLMREYKKELEQKLQA
ncbi:MAG: GIY-YIG nuclease family protein [Clostridia bacterium]|nr:GIY-YIG nuclease family protein [Clostridia bacterium]